MAGNLVGTSVAATHIGDHAHDLLTALIDDAANEPVKVTFGVNGAEAANIVPTTLTVTTLAGAAVNSAVRLHCQLYSVAMLELATAAATITATTGTAVSTDAQAGLIVDTAADGTLSLAVEDITAALVADMFLVVTPLGRLGESQEQVVTFA